jgi:hypothetical protein
MEVKSSAIEIILKSYSQGSKMFLQTNLKSAIQQLVFTTFLTCLRMDKKYVDVGLT